MSRRHNSLIVRAVLFCAGVFGGLVVSPFVAALAIVLLSLLWEAYEALALGLIMDLLWLPPGHLPLFTIGAIAVLWLFDPVRKRFLT